MPRQVIVWERHLPPEQLAAHLPEATEWLCNRVRDLSEVGYLVEEEATITVGNLGNDGLRLLLGHAVMNTETGKRLVRR